MDKTSGERLSFLLRGNEKILCQKCYSSIGANCVARDKC